MPNDYRELEARLRQRRYSSSDIDKAADAIANLRAQLATAQQERDEARDYDAFRAQRIITAETALAAEREAHERTRTKHAVACNTIAAMQREREERRSYQVLAALSSWLGNGMGDGSVSADDYEARIRDGVDRIVRVETARREKAEATLAAREALLREAQRALLTSARAARMQFESVAPQSVDWRRLEHELNATHDAIAAALAPEKGGTA